MRRQIVTRDVLVLMREALAKVKSDLLAQRCADGYWEGQLSNSALSTATAISALAIGRDAASSAPHASVDRLIECGLAWLEAGQNADGGWGDTPRSYSNIATTMLVRAAVILAGHSEHWSARLARAERYINDQGNVAGLRRRYGRDKTFAVPILTNAALAGLVSWQEVAALPFEAAMVPQRFYRWLRLPVVSYAIPALVAIGQVHFRRRPPRFFALRWLRHLAVAPTLRVLTQIQPASGGFLEAVPLTSFVVMSLIASGHEGHPVVRAGTQFLVESVRSNGSWPIDTNLATWNTTLALNALASAGADVAGQAKLDWLLGCQHTSRHPYTGAAPGGWGWTDLSGAVPDADDTAGALLALGHWYRSASATDQQRQRIEAAAEMGVSWLLDLQNSDGGWPTFCRGWGKLPFDRSGCDLTAHALRALAAWPNIAQRRAARAVRRGWSFLYRTQRDDGSWVPLWFGDQDHPTEENPVYGTSKVLLAFAELDAVGHAAVPRALRWLIESQQADGSWGRPSADAAGTEQTALALEAIAACRIALGQEPSALQTALQKGFSWLAEAVLSDRYRESAPIGFYFAKLWYYERLYPLTYTMAALGRGLCPWEGLDANCE